MRNDAIAIFLSTGALLVSACTGVRQGWPEVTPDGLQRVDNTRFSTVYIKPDADLTTYKKFGVTDCFVALQENWLRDQNTKRLNRFNRVSQEDADRLTAALGDECKSSFTTALSQPPAHEVIETFNAGDKVLVLRPNILNLNINAPEIKSASNIDHYTTSFGEMTLYLELLDGSTQDVLVRIIDRRKDAYDMRMWWSNSVTNKVSADRMLQRWANQMREELDKALDAQQQ